MAKIVTVSPQLIKQYATGGQTLSASIVGLTPRQLQAVPVRGTWSIQQIVVHLMDSDLIGSDRMKRVVAEKNPKLIGFDESAFAQSLYYDQIDPRMACDLFKRNRLLTTNLLRRLPHEAFARTGHHSERGLVTLAELVETYVNHLDHHLNFIYKKRRLLKNPL